MYNLAVVVINYRTPKMTIDCIGTLLHEISGINGCIVLVDNYSNDDSNSILEKWISDNDEDSKIKFIRSKINLGFSGGNNLGISEVESKNYLLLNSDTLIRAGAIKILLETASNNESAGLISPQLEGVDGTYQAGCFNSINPVSEFIGSAQTGLITQLLASYNVPRPITSKVDFPDWTSFACVLIKKQVFDSVGLLDADFFMYFEDAEFCSRATKAGWKIINNPDSHVVHLHGMSSKLEERSKSNIRLPRYYYESRARYFYKIYGWKGLFAANMLWTFGRVVSLIRQILGRKDKEVIRFKWKDIWINYLAPMKAYTPPIDK